MTTRLVLRALVEAGSSSLLDDAVALRRSASSLR
jgi:hypothetical protein